jgi:aquaporin Z
VIVEAVLTFFLVNSVLFGAVLGAAGKRAGFVIGMTLFFATLMGGPLTGASLNPARTVGPAVFTGNLDTLWIYLVGPLGGAGLAAGVFRILKNKK